MTTLHKLSIRGVRSYSPESESVIKFQHPLTIIVGPNGSGKTSIIECLKYVCSGEFPPLSDKGKSFVHDPDSCGEPIVKGQIKLAFKTAADKNVIAVKSFQVTAQKGRRTFKLIDSVLSTTDDSGQQKSVSYKCARMDDLMTQLMGVSTPILENVIFCHQLDADWPLSDDKSLKKRFDDIFAATKYTRALESIKKIRSDHLTKCKDLQRDLDIIANNLETVQKIEADKSRTHQALESLTTKWEAARRQKEIYHRSHNELSSELAMIEKFEISLSTARREFQTMEQEVAQARKRLQAEFTEPTSELIQRLSQFSEELERRQQKLTKLESDLKRAVKHEEESSTRYQSAVKTAGKVEFLEQQLKKKLKEGSALLASLPNEIPLPPARELQNLKDMDTFVTRVVQCSNAKQHEISKKKAEFNKSLKAMDKKIVMINQQLQERSQAEKLIEKEKEMLSGHMSNLDVDLTVTARKRERLLPLKQAAEQAQLELEAHLKSIAGEQLELKIEQDNRQLQSCNTELSAIAKTLSKLQSTNEARNRLVLQKRLLDESKDKVESMKLSIFPIVAGLLGPDHSQEPQLCLQLVDDELQRIGSQSKAYLRNERQKQDELLLLKERYSTVQRQVETATSRNESLNEQIASSKVSSLEEVDQLLQTRRKERDRLDHSIRNATEFANLFADWGAEAELAMSTSKPHSCGLCDRAFSPSELHSFVSRNAERVRSLRSPEELQSMRHSLNQVERRIGKLEQIRQLFDALASGTAALTAGQQDLLQVSKNISKAEAVISGLSTKSREIETRLEEHRQLRSQLLILNDAEKDMRRLETNLQCSEQAYQELPDADPELTQQQYSAVQARSQQLSQRINAMRQEMLRNDEVTRTLREKTQRLKEEAVALIRIDSRIEEIKQNISSYQDRLSQADVEIQRCAEALPPIEKQLQTALSDKQQFESETSAEIRLLDESLSSIMSQQKQLQGIQSDLEQIETELRTLKVNQGAILRLNAEAQDARTQVRDLQLQLQTQRDAIAAFESDRRGLQDNIEYRNRLDKFQKQRALVDRLVQDGSGSYRDHDHVKKECENARNMLMECERIIASSQGERSALISQMQSFESTLAEDRYRNIVTKHRHATIDLESTKMMLNDLDQYYRALDKSLMDFHSIKMSEINQVLKELWQCTYRGNDIDAIAIRSDHAEGAADLGAARQRKQYSYRLVMMQGDIELDMRGRSSAGQRVLASLLIRLALSDTFCVRCGILALDEPTQNLDEANIRALADALNALIERRKGHANFQLVLITHDEEFVELLRKRDNTDGVWRVFKDSNNCSRIKYIQNTY